MENLDSNSGEVISGSKISIDEHEGYLKRSQLKAGDILFSIAGTLGRIGIIKSSILPANTNQALAIIRAKEGNVNYISTVLRGRAVTDFIHRNPTVGAQPNLSLEQVGDLEIPYPSLDEQKKIGDYFKRLDHLITLHQYKQNMIFYEKSTILAYFWEQRKLGDDLVSIHTGTNLLGSITNTGMPLIKMGNIQRGYFDTSKVEFLAENEQPDKADIANYGDFFFNTRNTLELVGKGATWMKNSGEYAFNSNIARFEFRNIDTIFFNYLYNTDYMTKQIHARAMGTTSVAAIYPRTLDSVEYLAPCMKEQQKIGAYFRQLDHLITLHQRKIKYILKECLYGLF